MRRWLEPPGLATLPTPARVLVGFLDNQGRQRQNQTPRPGRETSGQGGGVVMATMTRGRVLPLAIATCHCKVTTDKSS